MMLVYNFVKNVTQIVRPVNLQLIVVPHAIPINLEKLT